MLADEIKLKIRDEFIHGYTNDAGVRQYPTVEALAKRHDLAKSTLYNYSKDEQWQIQKNQYQSELQDRVDAERLERMVEAGNRLDTNSIQIANAMLGRVAKRLQQAASMENEVPSLQVIDSVELRDLSGATINAQRIGKLALGQAQEISKVSADVRSPEAFREIMEQLDELEAAKSSSVGGVTH